MIIDIKKIPTKKLIGSKAINLQTLDRNKYNIPPTYFLVNHRKKINISEITKCTIDFVDKNNNKFKKFAVRSSSPIEDGKLKSYAGLYRTILNVQDDKLVESIISVMLSKPSIKGYGTSNVKISMDIIGVIIQEMIDADYSSVAFSVCPIEKNKNISRIEIVKGLCESLVSGKKAPSSIRYNSKTDTIYIQSQGSDKINKKKATEIFNIVHPIVSDISRLFKNAVDVEWAIKNDVLYILQSRPITTLGHYE